MLSSHSKKTTLATQDQKYHLNIITVLIGLGFFKSEYPPNLQAARRGAFIAKIDQICKKRGG
jgi:hypothetical protein